MCLCGQSGQSLLILEADREESHQHTLMCGSLLLVLPSSKAERERVCAKEQMEGHRRHVMWREDGRCSRTTFNLCELDHCRDCTRDPGTCSSPQLSVCAVLVGFQPYKSILRSCFAHSYKPYLCSWCCGVRVCWGRSLQSVTSCGLLSDSSSVDYIPLAVPTASCSHTCCRLFWCSSHICASCFETLVGKSFSKLGTDGQRLVSASHHLSGAKEAVWECSKAGVVFACSVNFLPQIVGHFEQDIIC